MAYAVVATNNARVLVSTELGFVWGTNFYEAAEFDNRDQLKHWVPTKLLEEFKWKLLKYPDCRYKQKQKAFTYKLGYSKKVNLDALSLPRVYTRRFYGKEEVAKIIGIAPNSLKTYYKHIGPIELEENPGRRGRKKSRITTEQVDQIFRIRLNNPNLNTGIVVLRYEEWLDSVSR